MKAESAPAIHHPDEVETRDREAIAQAVGKGLFTKYDFEIAEVTWLIPVGLKVGHTAILRENTLLLMPLERLFPGGH